MNQVWLMSLAFVLILGGSGISGCNDATEIPAEWALEDESLRRRPGHGHGGRGRGHGHGHKKVPPPVECKDPGEMVLTADDLGGPNPVLEGTYNKPCIRVRPGCQLTIKDIDSISMTGCSYCTDVYDGSSLTIITDDGDITCSVRSTAIRTRGNALVDWQAGCIQDPDDPPGTCTDGNISITGNNEWAIRMDDDSVLKLKGNKCEIFGRWYWITREEGTTQDFTACTEVNTVGMIREGEFPSH